MRVTAGTIATVIQTAATSLAAGILGLAVGAIAAGALSDPDPYRPVYDEPIYRDPQPRPRPHRPYYAEPSVVYYQDQRGWSRGARNGSATAATATAASIPTPAPSPAMTAWSISASRTDSILPLTTQRAASNGGAFSYCFQQERDCRAARRRSGRPGRGRR